MDRFTLKLCLFLFLASLLSGRTNELATLVGAITGTILLWPIYRRIVPPRMTKAPRQLAEEDSTKIVRQ